MLLDQKARGEEEYLEGIHHIERQLVLICMQFAIQYKKAIEEEAFQVLNATVAVEPDAGLLLARLLTPFSGVLFLSSAH